MLGKPPGFEEAVGSPFFFESYLAVGRWGGNMDINSDKQGAVLVTATGMTPNDTKVI